MRQFQFEKRRVKKILGKSLEKKTSEKRRVKKDERKKTREKKDERPNT